jgi:hypothetical protein
MFLVAVKRIGKGRTIFLTYEEILFKISGKHVGVGVIRVA